MDKFNPGAIGAIETAQTNLGYTSVVAPSDGRMGVRLIDPGNIVSASDSSPIVTLTLTKPAAVLFTLSARSLNDVRDAMAGGPVEVIAFSQDNRADPILGKIVGRCDAYTSANEIRWDPLCNRGRPRARGEAPGARSDSARLDPEVQRHRWTAPRCSGTPVNSAFEGIFSFPTDRPRPGRGRGDSYVPGAPVASGPHRSRKGKYATDSLFSALRPRHGDEKRAGGAPWLIHRADLDMS